MKREFLTELGLSKEQVDSIMAENGKDIQAQKDVVAQRDATIASLTTERDGLKTQVSGLSKDIKDLQNTVKGEEEVSKKLNELQEKYDKDTKELQGRIDAQRLDAATERFFANVDFASSLAKKAAIADFKSKQYKLKDDGTFEGADGYIDQLRKDDPDAFKKTESKGDDEKQKSMPRFTNQMWNQTVESRADGKNAPMNLGFRFVRQPPTQNE